MQNSRVGDGREPRWGAANGRGCRGREINPQPLNRGNAPGAQGPREFGRKGKRTMVQPESTKNKSMIKLAKAVLPVVLLVVSIPAAMAECQIGDAKLEEAVLQNPKFRGPANRQSVRDLRSLRDAAFTLWSYGRQADCERLLDSIRDLISGPSMTSLGGNDEEEAEKQISAEQPKAQRGGVTGHRADKGAKPLVSIDSLAPGLRADEIVGAAVRSSDDKIVGEVRNIVFRTKDRRDYAIVASGGFFTPGKDSIVVPMRSLKVSQERDSFFLPINLEKVRTIPLMPDQDYKWLSDETWRNRNDALFAAQLPVQHPHPRPSRGHR
jgi:hypothetical protein